MGKNDKAIPCISMPKLVIGFFDHEYEPLLGNLSRFINCFLRGGGVNCILKKEQTKEYEVKRL